MLDRVAKLNAQYTASLKKRDDLNEQAANTRLKLERADALVGGLASEAVRWGETVEQLKKDKVNQEGDMVLAAGFVAYIGPFTAVYREQLVASWIKRCQEYKIPVDTAFAMERSMVEAVRQRRLFVCLLISLLAIERTSAASSYGSARGTVESGRPPVYQGAGGH